MSNDLRLERLLGQVLAEAAPAQSPEQLVPDVLAAASRAGRRPRWLALATERPMRRSAQVLVGSPTLRLAYLMALVVLLLALAVAALVGGGFIPAPQDLAVVRPSPNTSEPVATAELSPEPERPRQVAYQRVEVRENGENGCDPPGLRPGRCYRTQLWISNLDGTGVYEPFPEMLTAEAIAWAPDGTALLFDGWNGEGDGRTYLSDLSGGAPRPFEIECPAPCLWNAETTFSPDGRKVAVVRAFNLDPEQGDPTHSVIATIDLVTGDVFELESTRVDLRDGSNWSPAWSPDGTRIAFVAGSNKFLGGAPNALVVIDADGTDLREIIPPGLGVEDPRWSPDGSRILFASSGLTLESASQHDLYTVRPDGTDLRRLTTGGFSHGATWTIDGRIVFRRTPPSAGDAVTVEVWIMDADGGNPARLDANNPTEMTAAGCASCPYPLTELTLGLEAFGAFPNAQWQPMP